MSKIGVLDILFIIGLIISIGIFLEIIEFAKWKNCYDHSFEITGCEKYIDY